MKKCLILLILIAGMKLYSETKPISESAIEDLVVTNEDEFIQKISSFENDVRRLLSAPTNVATKSNADHLYNHISTFIEIFGDRYKYSGGNVFEYVDDLLGRLSVRFKLKSPNPLLIPIHEEVIETHGDETPSITDLLSFAATGKDLPLTQSEAYLARPLLQKALLNSKVVRELRRRTGRFNELFIRAIAKERAHRDHFVFYHAQDKNFILFYDVLRELMRQLYQKEIPQNFEYMRLPFTTAYNKTLAQIIKKVVRGDRAAEIVQLLISANISLFGNSLDWSENTFRYFAANASISPPAQLLGLIFNALDLDSKYIRELELLFKRFAPEDGGNLLQIFVPVNKVNTYVYLAQAYGRPLSGPSTLPSKIITVKDSTYDPATLDAKTYLDLYREHPEFIDHEDMDRIQARILVTDDFLLNPESEVKIYRYNMMPEYGLTEYKKELEVIVAKVIEERGKALLLPLSMTDLDARLFAAVRRDDIKAVMDIVEEGAYLETKDHYGRAPVMIAQALGHKAIENFLMEYPLVITGNANAATNGLIKAVNGNQPLEVAQFFVEHGATVNVLKEDDLGTPLYTTLIHDRYDLAELLLSHGADPNLGNKNFPLMLVVSHQNIVLTHLLLKYNARTTIKDAFGHTPLHYAVSCKDELLSELLLTHHAEVNAINHNDLTPLDMALKVDASKELIDLLLKNGAKTGQELLAFKEQKK